MALKECRTCNSPLHDRARQDGTETIRIKSFRVFDLKYMSLNLENVNFFQDAK